MDHIDVIKSRLLLSDIVGKKVKLVKRGDNFIGLCPFHHEKTPSFSVNNTKGLYYCFGCSAYGDIFEFISKTEGLSFKEVVDRLALVVGIELPKNRYIEKQENGIFSALNLAANWFSRELSNNLNAMNYLKQRNIFPKVISKFKIGYAPSSGLKQYFNSINIEDNVLLKATLIGKNFCDYFYNRLIFPIHNIAGRVIAFGGRAINSEQQPKYLNSPESEIFKKKNNLYAMNFALSKIRKKQYAFVVEGYMDVIALHQAEICNSVAPLGTAISLEQIRNLWSFTKEVCICMDGDNAGYSSAIRIAELVLQVLEPGYTLKFVVLPKNKDPYDVCNELEYNKKNILTIFNNFTKLHSEFLWDHVVNNNLQDYTKFAPEKYSILEYKFMEYVNIIKNSRIKKYYKDYFYSKVFELRNKKTTPPSNKKFSHEYLRNHSPELIEIEQNQIIILHIVITFPDILNNPICFEQFADLDIVNKSMEKLKQHIIDIKSEIIDITQEILIEKLEVLSMKKVIKYIFDKTSALGKQLSDANSAKAVWNNIMLLQELSSLRQEKIEARLSGNLELEDELISKIKRLEFHLKEMQMKFIQE
ncbi:DNA primase [Wolbachia endosymbiont of Pentidionis agamae]|uniref:DNA primase n=1 Tax=Wolbachia endosymbiont of Pentidionis agamae TaxID=3110435 RepID=UPI002FD5EB3E